MLETKLIPHLIDRGIYPAVVYHEVVYNAVLSDCPDIQSWLSYGFYEDAIVAQYIADGIKSERIKVKTFRI